MSLGKNPIKPPKVDPEEILQMAGQQLKQWQGTVNPALYVKRASNGFIVEIMGMGPPTVEIYTELKNTLTRIEEIMKGLE